MPHRAQPDNKLDLLSGPRTVESAGEVRLLSGIKVKMLFSHSLSTPGKFMGSLLSFRLDGQTALVTGAARGLGRAIALALAEAGADVALGLRDVKQDGGVASEIEALGRKAMPFADGDEQPRAGPSGEFAVSGGWASSTSW